MTLHESDTSHWGLFAFITEFFFVNCYFWNISLAKNLVWRGMLIPSFGVSTTILKPVGFFCRWYKLNFGLLQARLNRWYKLNFGLLQGQVKLYHFYEWIVAKRQIFNFLYKFLGITYWKRHWTTILDTDLDALLPFKWIWTRLTPE